MISSRVKEKNFFHRNKQKLIIFSSQAKEVSSYFVVNNQLGEWVGLWLSQINWVSFSGSPFSSFTPLWMSGVHSSQRARSWLDTFLGLSLLHDNSLHLDQNQIRSLLPGFLLTSDRHVAILRRLNIGLGILLRFQIISWNEPLMGHTPDLSFLKEDWSQLCPSKVFKKRIDPNRSIP